MKVLAIAATTVTRRDLEEALSAKLMSVRVRPEIALRDGSPSRSCLVAVLVKRRDTPRSSRRVGFSPPSASIMCQEGGLNDDPQEARVNISQARTRHEVAARHTDVVGDLLRAPTVREVVRHLLRGRQDRTPSSRSGLATHDCFTRTVGAPTLRVRLRASGVRGNDTGVRLRDTGVRLGDGNVRLGYSGAGLRRSSVILRRSSFKLRRASFILPGNGDRHRRRSQSPFPLVPRLLACCTNRWRENRDWLRLRCLSLFPVRRRVPRPLFLTVVPPGGAVITLLCN
jgi:hypothetical protein